LAEVEALWAFRLRRLRPAVPIAGLVDRVVFTQPPPHGVLRCCACGTLRREPAGCRLGEAYARDALRASAFPRLARLGRAGPAGPARGARSVPVPARAAPHSGRGPAAAPRRSRVRGSRTPTCWAFRTVTRSASMR